MVPTHTKTCAGKLRKVEEKREMKKLEAFPTHQTCDNSLRALKLRRTWSVFYLTKKTVSQTILHGLIILIVYGINIDLVRFWLIKNAKTQKRKNSPAPENCKSLLGSFGFPAAGAAPLQIHKNPKFKFVQEIIVDIEKIHKKVRAKPK